MNGKVERQRTRLSAVCSREDGFVYCDTGYGYRILRELYNESFFKASLYNGIGYDCWLLAVVSPVVGAKR